MRIEPAGDRAVVLYSEEAGRSAAEDAGVVEAARLPWIVDVIPAYDTLTVVYDPLAVGRADAIYDAVAGALTALLERPSAAARREPRTVEIPVRYGGADGPDLEVCSARAGMDPAAFVAAHAGAVYTVAMIDRKSVV